MSHDSYKNYDDQYPFFVPFFAYKGISIFSDQELSEIILKSLQFLQQQRNVQILGYIIMHNHVKLILDGENITTHIRSMKTNTEREIIDSLKDRGRYRLLQVLRGMHGRYQVWQPGSKPKLIVSDSMMIRKLENIHLSPVKAGFVEKAEHWRYSSARNYIDNQGLIPIQQYQR
jgi:putative transposase